MRAAVRVRRARRLVLGTEAHERLVVARSGSPLVIAFNRGREITGYAMAMMAKSNILEPPVLEILDLEALADIFKTLFVEPNPVPVKHCMMRAGIIRSDEVRLPLCEMSEANRLLVEKVADATLASLR